MDFDPYYVTEAGGLLRKTHRHLISALSQIPLEEEKVTALSLSNSVQRLNSGLSLHKLTSLERNRIALQYVKYREDIENEKKGGGARIQRFEYAMRNYAEESRKRGYFDKVKVIDKVRTTTDYQSQNAMDQLLLVKNDAL